MIDKLSWCIQNYNLLCKFTILKILQMTEVTKELLADDGKFTYIKREPPSEKLPDGIVTYWLLKHKSSAFKADGNPNHFAASKNQSPCSQRMPAPCSSSGAPISISPKATLQERPHLRRQKQRQDSLQLQ